MQFWTFDQIHPNSSVSAVVVAFEITQQVSLKALQSALASVVERHEILRSQFEESEGGLNVVVHPEAAVALRVSAVHTRDAALAMAQELGRTPTALARPPLLQATLLTWATDRHILVLVSHHAAVDGGSLNILIKELGQIYTAAASGEHPPSADAEQLSVTLTDVTADEARPEVRLRWDCDLEYWLTELSTLEPGEGIVPLRDSNGHGANTWMHVLSPALGQQLRAAARKMRATSTMMLLTVWAYQVMDHFNLDNVVVGVPISARDDSSKREVVGLLMNTVPLAVRRVSEPFLDQLTAVRRSFIRGLQHRRVPFTLVARKCRPENSVESIPLYNVMFTQGQGSVLRLDDQRARRVEVENDRSEVPWSMVVVDEESGSIRIKIQVKDTEVDSDSVRVIGQEFLGRLARIAAPADSDQSFNNSGESCREF